MRYENIVHLIKIFSTFGTLITNIKKENCQLPKILKFSSSLLDTQTYQSIDGCINDE